MSDQELLKMYAAVEFIEPPSARADMRRVFDDLRDSRLRTAALERERDALRAALVLALDEFRMESAMVDDGGTAHQPSVTWTPGGWRTHRAAIEAVRAALATAPDERKT